jgi:tetratricopeptide (TPR) repeat protein
MRSGDDPISYTWCEYRFGLAENKPHLSYIINEGWGRTSRDGAPTLWAFRDEVLKENCPRITKSGVEKVISELASNIIDWYSDGRINLNRFCGRRDLLRDLFNKMQKSVEVTGVGGIGKTALCEVVLLVYKLLGRNIVYTGLDEGYASGTGYEYAAEKLPANRFPDLTLDTVAGALGFGEELTGIDDKTKIAAILQRLDANGSILFIDNYQDNEGLNELITKSNSLNRGCIVVSAKKELKLAVNRVHVKNIEETERSKLVKIMASRLGKEVSEEEARKIEEIAEGHPVATYLLVSNLGRVGIEEMASFKEGLNFSRDTDVKHYMSRVIESGLSTEAYAALKDLAVIDEKIDRKAMYTAVSTVYSSSRDLLGELLDASILDREESTLIWTYNQIREAVLEDDPRRHRLAASYYRCKLDISGAIEDEIKMLYHLSKFGYTDEIFGSFLSLAESIKEGDPALRVLPLLGTEIIKHIGEKDKATVYGVLGVIYAKIALYRDMADNCKKAIAAHEKALEVYSLNDFPVKYAGIQNNLGTAYARLAEVEEKPENGKKAIAAYEQALEVYSLDDFPLQFAMTQLNLGPAYARLAEVEKKAENCKKAIAACEKALEVYSLSGFPRDYALTQNNLGITYTRLAEVEENAENCKKAIAACEKALEVYSLSGFPRDYALTQNNLGDAYCTLAAVKEKPKNCEKAIKAYEEALKVFTAENFPENYQLIRRVLLRAFDFCEGDITGVKSIQQNNEQ